MQRALPPFPFSARSLPACRGGFVSRISGSRSQPGRPGGRGGGSRKRRGAGAGGPRPPARDVRPRDPFHERRPGPDLRPRGPGRVETPVVRVAARGVARGAALRSPLVLAGLGGRGAFPARGVPLRRRRVVGSASPVRTRAARVRRLARSVRRRLGVLVRRLGVDHPPPAGVSRADVGHRPPLQRSAPAGDLRLRGRPRRFRRPGRVRGRDRRRRGLLDRALDRVPAPRRACDRGNGDPAAGRRLPLRKLSRCDAPGGRQRRGRGDGWEGRGTSTGGRRTPETTGRTC